MPSNFFYFNTGGIGDFLTILFFMENLRLNFSDPAQEKTNFYIIVHKNRETFLSLAQEYDYVKIIELNRRNIPRVFLYLLHSVFQRNYAITHMTFGRIPLSIKILGKLITLRRESVFFGFDDGARLNKYLYTKTIPFNHDILTFETMKELVREMGFSVKKELPDFKYPKLEGVIEKHNLVANKFIVLHPFAGAYPRNLPEKKFVLLVKKIVTDFADYQLVIIGSANERAKTAVMLTKASSAEKVLNLCGTLSLPELGNLIDQSRLFIGGDSGISHLAAMLQKKSLILGNYSNPCWLPLYNQNAIVLYDASRCPCAPCNKKKCLDECKTDSLRCLVDISDNLIESKLTESLNN